MNGTSSVKMPFELKANLFLYVVVVLGCGWPQVLWLVGILTGQKSPVWLPVLCVACLLIMPFLFGNLIIRLDETGISQGFAMLRTFMPYETVSGVHRESRRTRGGTTTVLVITKRDSRKRIVVWLSIFDKIKVADGMALLARKAPQAHIVDALQSPFQP